METSHGWLKSQNIYIELMELESTNNKQIGMIIGKAPRITSLPDLWASLHMQISNSNLEQRICSETPPFQLNFDNIGNKIKQHKNPSDHCHMLQGPCQASNNNLS